MLYDIKNTIQTFLSATTFKYQLKRVGNWKENTLVCSWQSKKLKAIQWSKTEPDDRGKAKDVEAFFFSILN